MLPNADFGRSNQHFRVSFRRSFQRLVAQIGYSHPPKGPRKSAFHLWFILPKSSFRRHKVVTKDHSIPEKPTHRITSCATILCNHLASHRLHCAVVRNRRSLLWIRLYSKTRRNSPAKADQACHTLLTKFSVIEQSCRFSKWRIITRIRFPTSK